MATDPRVDAYIEMQAAFAQPILTHVRMAMALACPGADETIKWGRPFWTLNGTMLAMMSGFKAHVSIGAWRPIGSSAPGRAQAGWDRITALADLPDVATLAGQLGAAIAAAAEAPVIKPARMPKAEVKTPPDVMAALTAAGAAVAFSALPAGARREYLDWFADAKRPETRARRIVEATGWIVEGKRRNWKYERC